MMTVRFPDGTSIRYNDATWVGRQSAQYGFIDLYTKQNGDWIAQVPVTALLEVRHSCEVFNPVRDRTHDRISQLETQIRGLRRDVKALTGGKR